nr:hypothetical protein [Salarchaeum sp. JOR-1]
MNRTSAFRAADRVRAEEPEQRPEFLVDGEVVVVGRARRHQSDRGVLEGSHVRRPDAARHHVEEVLQEARTRPAIDGRADDVRVRLHDPPEGVRRVARVVFEAAAVRRVEVVLREVEQARLRVRGRAVERAFDRRLRLRLLRHAPDDTEHVRHTPGFAAR